MSEVIIVQVKSAKRAILQQTLFDLSFFIEFDHRNHSITAKLEWQMKNNYFINFKIHTDTF